ncbi:unnamed protein product [Clonostachys rhizophaga]|uniref:Xylanolytic transcriptional activator regulatory domain-containing protein n=1 Tax=Clonostachys rhizophaga TaxID=160324 RepID=A0A9N9YM74_9HYPO|nr:unnamed protein product [Clonostachys rhizophaga]
MSQFVNSLLPSNIRVESLETGIDLKAIVNEFQHWTDKETDRGSCSSQPTLPGDVAQENNPGILNESSSPQLNPIRGLPLDVTCKTLVEAYFNQFHRTYPIFNKNTIEAEVAGMAFLFEHEPIDINFRSVRAYLIMTLGAALLHRSRRVSDETLASFRVPYHEVVRICLEDPSVESIQILHLLALQSIHDPQGWQPWVITGFLGRQAMSIGLNQNAKPSSQATFFEMEWRHRLFWSIFSMDRLVSVSYGLPFAIEENDFNVPLPGVTMEEFASSQQADYLLTLQIARQSIALRDLEGKMLSQIHLETREHQTQFAHGRDHHHHVIDRFCAQAQDWYTQGCLYSRMDDSDVPIHTTISWLTVNYHRILAMLYYPSKLNSQSSTYGPGRLQHIAQTYVQSLHVQFQDGHLAFSHITINRLLVICRILLYCYSSMTEHADLEDVIDKSIIILEEFSPAWESAQLCSLQFQQFKRIAATTYEENDTTSPMSTTTEHCTLESLIDQSETLIEKVMGPSSIHNYLAIARSSYRAQMNEGVYSHDNAFRPDG